MNRVALAAQLSQPQQCSLTKRLTLGIQLCGLRYVDCTASAGSLFSNSHSTVSLHLPCPQPASAPPPSLSELSPPVGAVCVAFRSTLGPDMADKLTGDHQTVKNLLATLDTLGADDTNFDMQLRARWGRTQQL